MAKQLEILFGFIVLIGVIVIFIVGIIWARPRGEEVTAQRQYKEDQLLGQLRSLDNNRLNAMYEGVKNLSVHGKVPVEKFSKTEAGVANPFIPYYLRK